MPTHHTTGPLALVHFGMACIPIIVQPDIEAGCANAADAEAHANASTAAPLKNFRNASSSSNRSGRGEATISTDPSETFPLQSPR